MDTATLSGYRALNDAALVEVKSALERQGLTVVNVDNALRCELKLGETLTGYGFFVSAPFVFSLDRQPQSEPEDEFDREHREKGRRYFEIDFRKFQESLMYEAFSGTPKMECYLFIVGSEQFVQDEANRRRRCILESDVSIARKFVVTLPQALALTRSPFSLSEEGEAEGKDKPTFDAIQELLYLKEDAPAVTVTFSRRELEQELKADSVLLASSVHLEIQKRTEGILLRIMGPEYRVRWFSDGVRLARLGDPKGVPIEYASSGEQKAFAFAHFLATLADTAGPDMRLGVYGALDGLSLIWFLGALDILREFSFATGASIRMQLPQNDRRSLATRKFAHIATVIKTAQYPYD
jgi:hypothetical protein